MRSTPASLYARQYRVGAQATSGLALAVLMVWIRSPVSVWKNSRLAPFACVSKHGRCLWPSEGQLTFVAASY